MTDARPPAAPDTRLGKGLRMGSLVLASALVAVIGHLVIAAVVGGLDVPAPPGETGTMPLAPAVSLAVGAVVAGAALLLASLLLPRTIHAVAVTQWICMVVLALSGAPIGLSWDDVSSPVGLLVLHVLVGVVVIVGLDWAMDDLATVDA